MKKVIPCILLKEGQAWLSDGTLLEQAGEYCQTCSNSGADSLLFADLSETEEAHHRNMECLKQIVKDYTGSFVAGGPCFHIDDVKKYLYTGADGMFFTTGASEELMKECISRFHADRVGFMTSDREEAQRACELGVRRFYCLDPQENSLVTALQDREEVQVFAADNGSHSALKDGAAGALLCVPVDEAGSGMQVKHQLRDAGFQTDVFEPAFSFSDFKLDAKGLIPVVVQDWRSDEVLMVAYMNEEAYQMTVHTGRMTYYSRSRRSLWIKGETSGHFQYVKSLKIDCDQDTLLARVVQVGAACHTGNRSCFYRDIVSRETAADSPYKVLESVYNTIMDRKLHPKEGSYTNYLFQKGLDKILKKVGEEATEIVIAAKNPESQEVVYELGDFLYHVMVLMADKEITWEDVARELANRE